MGLLEPGVSETVVASLLAVMKEARDEVVRWLKRRRPTQAGQLAHIPKVCSILTALMM